MCRSASDGSREGSGRECGGGGVGRVVSDIRTGFVDDRCTKRNASSGFCV